jgi:hypothetical protein
MTPLELVGLAVCVAALVALHVDTRSPDGMPSRRQRRMWERERLVQPKWSRRTW